MTQALPLSMVLKRGAVGPEVDQLKLMLNLAGQRVLEPQDGSFDATMEQAVRSFQASHGLNVDGRVGAQTWRVLQVAAYAWEGKTASPESAGATASAAPGTTQAVGVAALADFGFPLAVRPIDWRGGYRFFGANRPGGRKHAGCDLYAPLNTPIYAIADGVLIRDPYRFYLGTDAVEVRHGSLLIRYGEVVAGSCKQRAGQKIQRGELFAKVGQCEGISQPMLHFELYTNGTDSSDLWGKKLPPYMRRDDVTDPAAYLDKWVENLPTG
jgi:murein DD-endopeptidase MepM/ murein hydrolase activator NlpD